MYIETVIILFSLSFGSFLNVCIHRIPLGLSVIYKRSFCPDCKKEIKFYDNIPVLSYLLLKGRCRFCKNVISVRYPAVELITAILTIFAYLKTGVTVDFFIMSVFLYSIIVISFIDIRHGIIPNSISLSGIVFFTFTSFFTENLTISESLTGSFTGFSIFFLIIAIYFLLTGKEGMGMGDVKLLAMIGAYTGVKGVLFTILISSFTGTLTGIFFMILKGNNMKSSLPFGPFLSFGAVLYLFHGDGIIKWYLNLVM